MLVTVLTVAALVVAYLYARREILAALDAWRAQDDARRIVARLDAYIRDVDANRRR